MTGANVIVIPHERSECRDLLRSVEVLDLPSRSRQALMGLRDDKRAE
jgi:hypothetical protein